MNPKRLGQVAHLAVSVSLLVGLARFVDASELVSRLGQMQVTWLWRRRSRAGAYLQSDTLL